MGLRGGKRPAAIDSGAQVLSARPTVKTSAEVVAGLPGAQNRFLC